MRKSDPKGIAVIRAGAIGDTLVLFPLLAALRARHRGARIISLGRTEVFDLAVEEGLCDAAFSPDSAAIWKLRTPDLAVTREEVSIFDGIGTVLDFDGGELSKERLEFLGIERWRTLRPLPPDEFAAPAASFYLEQAGLAGFPHFVMSSRASARPAGRAAAVAILPGAGSPRKRAPARWFAAISRRARRRGMEVALVSGEADAEAIRNYEAAGGVADVRLASLPLAELRRRLAECGCFVANDSGIAHLAAWVGLPGIVGFVSTDPRVWAPPAPAVIPTYPQRGGIRRGSRARAR